MFEPNGVRGGIAASLERYGHELNLGAQSLVAQGIAPWENLPGLALSLRRLGRGDNPRRLWIKRCKISNETAYSNISTCKLPGCLKSVHALTYCDYLSRSQDRSRAFVQ